MGREDCPWGPGSSGPFWGWGVRGRHLEVRCGNPTCGCVWDACELRPAQTWTGEAGRRQRSNGLQQPLRGKEQQAPPPHLVQPPALHRPG